MKSKKKAFTLVELVIVIAVIGILAAVLIPTFSGVIERAHVAADQATVGNMNTQLALGSVRYADFRIAYAEEEINLHTASGARTYLLENGFKDSDFTPKAKDTGYLYDKTECRVLIVKVENGAATEATFPANYVSIGFTTIDPALYEIFTPELTLTNLTEEQHVHTVEEIPAVEPTCTEPGLTEGKKCSVCGEVLETQTVIPAGHTEEEIPAKPATCTESGLTEGKKCSVCGEILQAQTEIPATGQHKDENSDNQCDVCSVFLIAYSLNGETKTASVSPDNVTVDDGGYRFANGAYLQTAAVTDAVAKGIAVSMWTRKINNDWNRMVGVILDTLTINSASLQNVNLSMTAGNLSLAKQDTPTSRLWEIYPGKSGAGSSLNQNAWWLMDMYEKYTTDEAWYYQTYVISADGIVSMYSNGILAYRYNNCQGTVNEIYQTISTNDMMKKFLEAAQSSGVRIAECNGSDTYASVKDISVTYAMNDAEVKEAYDNIVGIIETVGNEGCTTTIDEKVTSTEITLGVGESVMYDFFNYNKGGALWNNFVVKTTAQNNPVRFIRADNWAFVDGSVEPNIGICSNNNTFTQAQMNGARVQMTVTNNGSSIITEATITTAGGDRQEYKITIENVTITSLTVCLTVDLSYLTLYKAQKA